MTPLTPQIKTTLRLTGPRVHLVPLHPDDVTPNYVAWLNDTQVNRYLESRFATHTLESTRAFAQACWQAPHTILLAIRLIQGNRHIGNIKLGPIDFHHLRGDIGLIIGDRSCWGQGYATEAIGLLAEWALHQAGLRKLTAGAYASNQASIRAFLKCGFSQEAVLPGQALLNGKPEDTVLLGRTLTCN